MRDLTAIDVSYDTAYLAAAGGDPAPLIRGQAAGIPVAARRACRVPH